MTDNTTLHAGYMPGPIPSGTEGGAKSYDFEGKVEGVTGGEVDSHVMEPEFDSLMPSADQGNLEPTGDGTAQGAK